MRVGRLGLLIQTTEVLKKETKYIKYINTVLNIWRCLVIYKLSITNSPLEIIADIFQLINRIMYLLSSI